MRLPFANTTVKHWNPGATLPLVLPVHLVCNTSDEAIYENIRVNSELRVIGHGHTEGRKHPWLNASDAHGGVAVLCGSGPSLADHLGDIRARAAAGETIFALNGAARFLAERGIMPDYQVILDARPQTADLVGPARQHLFASQVHPDCFAKAPSAILWHLQVGGLERLLPENNGGYVLIGGAASVGNTATCVVYAMGFRSLHLYGYDSSHRGDASHAFAQPMNEGEPCAVVRFAGKDYLASLTMKLQAEKFMVTSAALKAAGCAIEVHGDGLLPDMYRAPLDVLEEAEKYERLWWMETYREQSPGEDCAPLFLDLVQPDGLVIDFGCGTGRASILLAQNEIPTLLVDFTENSRDIAAMGLPFLQADLRKPIPASAPYGLCADVLEHIPPESVDDVVTNILTAAASVFFQISTVPDNLGSLIGHSLHLTVRPHDWWAALFARLGYEIAWQEAGDVSSMFHVRRRPAA